MESHCKLCLDIYSRATEEGCLAVLAVLGMHIDKESWEQRTNRLMGEHHPAEKKVGQRTDTLLPSVMLYPARSGVILLAANPRVKQKSD